MLSKQVRQTFIDYFVRNGHRAMPSASLIPYGDNTILFTNAGMNQFKNAFLGLEKRDYMRAVTSQKVMRVSGKHNDLENVGPSKRHHTFFEMLGNFSFGDYFKDDAMKFALELLEKEYGFERERLWFTVYKDDDEAITLWQKHGIKADRILRFGEKDNFWTMGATGPCGPNSEIHYYTGDKKENNLAKWVNNDDDSSEITVEIWNLVFMQFNRTADNVLQPLPQTGVDTGMGFERLCRLLQKGENNYDTDLFMPLLEHTQQLARQTTEQRVANIIPYRVIADHVRSAAFLIGDGVLPGNDGRNYVLRMVMRRAMRYGRKLGFEDPFLHQLAETVIDRMGDVYPELAQNRARILSTILQEEVRFERTLDQGLERLGQIIKQSPDKVISGEAAFKLYDTYGLPIEITRDEARDLGYSVDDKGFDSAKQAARDKNKGTGQFTTDYGKLAAYKEAIEALKADKTLPDAGVGYDPYHALTQSTQIVAILLNGEMTDRAVASEADSSDVFEFVLRETSFYVASGGQIGDTGILVNGDIWSADVIDVQRPLPGLIVHTCKVTHGMPRVGDECEARVNASRRRAIERNHTATHLLQKCLRLTLGDHVGQQGSLVNEQRLRFDFSHSAALSAKEMTQVSDMLNQAILDNTPVIDAQMSYDAAIKTGAMAFFSEKYGDVVRVVSIGEFSKELCGGTHVRATGDIGSAVIVGESAVSAGVRRIEVLTGHGALAQARQQTQQLGEVARLVNATGGDVVEHTARLANDLKETQKQLETLKREIAKARFEAVLGSAAAVNGAHVLVAEVPAESNDQMREMSDWFRDRYPSSVTVLASVIADKPALMVSVSNDLTKKLNAGNIIKEIAPIVGGKGGGRPNMATAGGTDAGKIADALARSRAIVAEALGKE